MSFQELAELMIQISELIDRSHMKFLLKSIWNLPEVIQLLKVHTKIPKLHRIVLLKTSLKYIIHQAKTRSHGNIKVEEVVNEPN